MAVRRVTRSLRQFASKLEAQFQYTAKTNTDQYTNPTRPQPAAGAQIYRRQSVAASRLVWCYHECMNRPSQVDGPADDAQPLSRSSGAFVSMLAGFGCIRWRCQG